VQVLSGKRPERPKHPPLSNELWDLAQYCWEQEPLRRPQISEVVFRLERASTVRQHHLEVADIVVEESTTSEGTPRRWSCSLWHAPASIARRFRLTRSNDAHYKIPPPTPRKVWQYHKLGEPSTSPCFASDGFHNIEPDGSETNLHGTTSGELDEPIAVRGGTLGLCGLLRSSASRKSNRGTPPPQNRLSEKV
jgi:hypothetical protein